MKKYFITGVGTGIGKTFLTANLCSAVITRGKSVEALKPVVTGFPEDFSGDSDVKTILAALKIPLNMESIEQISPWRFSEPVSPDIAARLEKREIIFSEIVEFCRTAFVLKKDFLFIEGIGGVMTPLNKQKTVADLMKTLKIPVILVSGTYLGCLSHSLTAIETLKQRKIPVHAMIVNESAETAPNSAEILKSLRNFTARPIFFLPRGKDVAALQKPIDKILDFL